MPLAGGEESSMKSPATLASRMTRSRASSSTVPASSTNLRRKAEQAAALRPAPRSEAATTISVPKIKKRRITKAAPPTPSTSTTPPRPLIPLGDGSPALLPPVLSFSLSSAISHLASVDPRFQRMYDSVPCKPFQPPLSAVDPFRTLVTSIIGQQVSWMAARAINNRFRKLFGFGEGSDPDEGFPTPGMVARADVMSLKGVGLSTRKAEYVISLAEHFVSGQLSSELLRDGTDEEIAKALIAVRGIGRWTVDMFLMFSLRRPDVLPVGDLGVQKGLLRWALAAHEALPVSKAKEGKAASAAKAKYAKEKATVQDKVNAQGDGEIDTRIRTPPPEGRAGLGAPPTPVTPGAALQIVPAALHTPYVAKKTGAPPPTPETPSVAAETLEVSARALPPLAPAALLASMRDAEGWDAHRAAPLVEGLSIELVESRLAGKKAKGGAYLTPQEMELLTDAWRPYRSLGVYYMWPAGEDF